MRQRLARSASRIRGDVPLAILDVVLVVAAYTLLLLARFDFTVPTRYWDAYRVFLPVACVVQLGSTLLWGGYGRTWRYASIDEARRLLLAGLTSGCVLFLIFGWNERDVPVTVLVAGPLLATFFMGLMRFQSRLFAFRRYGRSAGHRIAVVGAGSEAAAALREMQHNPSLGLVPVAVVDDDRSLKWRSIHGVRVAGAIDNLAAVITEHRAEQILVAVSSPSRSLIRRVATAGEITGTPVRVLRPSASWVHGMPRLRDIRELDIEDLLRRESVDTDPAPVRRLLEGKRVLVTGGGGWIGSEIVRQVSAFGPEHLVVLDHDETHLHDVVQSVNTEVDVALVDIRDASALRATFAQVRPEVVFHAAAHKHVPILEDFACEAVLTNVFGTLNVLEACKHNRTPHLVCISTDKAAKPTSVMGASKWLAEQVLLARAPDDGYCAVRFGNVLGSRGSVIPTFQRQIAAGGPVTVTDREMTRYFMSTDEAVRLVLFGGATTDGCEVLALEMGEQVNIYELAERMIRLCGYQPHEDIEIRLSGLRPGENVREALVGPAERTKIGTGSPVVRIVPCRLDRETLDHALDELGNLAAEGDHAAVRIALLELSARVSLESVSLSDQPRAH